MICQTLSLSVLSLLAAPRAYAQGAASEATADTSAASSPNETVSGALKAWYQSTWTATGSVRIEADDPDNEDMGMMVIGGPASKGAPFAGGIEVVRTARGEVLIASKKAFPGVAILRTGSQTIANTTAPINSPIDVEMLHADVASMLNAKTFSKWAAKNAQWKLRENAETNARTYRAKLMAPEPEMPDMDGFDDEAGGMPPMSDPMSPRILFSVVDITLNKAGAITEIALHVTRNDPMATIAEVAEESGEVDFEALMDAEPVEGPVHHIKLKVSADEPSIRGKELLKRLAPAVR